MLHNIIQRYRVNRKYGVGFFGSMLIAWQHRHWAVVAR
jgi:hypothetical protein